MLTGTAGRKGDLVLRPARFRPSKKGVEHERRVREPFSGLPPGITLSHLLEGTVGKGDEDGSLSTKARFVHGKAYHDPVPSASTSTILDPGSWIRFVQDHGNPATATHCGDSKTRSAYAVLLLSACSPPIACMPHSEAPVRTCAMRDGRDRCVHRGEGSEARGGKPSTATAVIRLRSLRVDLDRPLRVVD